VLGTFSPPPVYPILDVDVARGHGWALPELAARLAATDCRLLQLRAKQLTAAAFLNLAVTVQQILPPSCRLIINDRVDIAVLAAAAGAHVGQDDLPPAAARCLLAPEAILGYSTHGVLQVEAARHAPVDYLAIGPVFATATKQNPDPVVGLEGVRAARALYRGPLVAIGGITLENCAAVWEAGADTIALVSGYLKLPDPVALVRQFQLAFAAIPRQSKRDRG